MIDIARLPAEILTSTAAVVWNREVRDGKATKVPYNPQRPSTRAAVDDPTTWAPFTTAIDAVEDGKAHGAGIVLGGGLVGVDLDGCCNLETGAIDDDALAIVRALDSYTEKSPSGTGLHIIVRGALPPGGRRKGRVEMYADGRYFTVTGAHLDGTPSTIEDRTAALASPHARIFGESANGNGHRAAPIAAGPLDLDDATLLDRAQRAANGATFSALWGGDTSLHGGDDSAADLALCNLLAFWTGADAGRMDRLFRRSGLMRPKWDGRRGDSTYGERTIATAIAGCRETYQSHPIADRRTPTPAGSRTPITLANVHDEFARWLGPEYDLDAIDAVLATAAAEKLKGDPLWLLLVSGSGNAKTETVSPLAGAGALVTSTISSEGALLSGSSTREKAKDSTGGLLRRIGTRGVLVIKDVTSILSMDRNTRAGMLAALREVHDGRWQRNVGTDGGKTLTWEGRIAVVGAVTTAWDQAHSVIASMGDRFVLLRLDSHIGRQSARQQAMRNCGSENLMREAFADVVARMLATVNPAADHPLTDAEHDRIGQAADLVTLCRTAIEYDYKGDVLDSHAPEMPTRFAKQLVQMLRGALAIGMDRTRALRLAMRCARDSMPPLRLAILDDVAANPRSRTHDVRTRLQKPRATVDRQLQALHMLGVLTCDEVEIIADTKSKWYYSVAETVDASVLRVPDL